MRAANSAGQRAPSAASASVTPAKASGAPTNLGVTGGDEQVTLNWTAPASNGGEMITGYEYEQNGSGAWISTGGTAPSATVTGLMNGLSYRFKVRALNSVGEGAASRRLVERHAGEGAGRADESERHGQRSKRGADLDGARIERRGDDPALRIRAGLFRHLDLHRWHGPEHHGAQPDQRPELRLPGAGGQQHWGERGLRFAIGHADVHAGRAGHAVWPQRHARQPAGDAQLGPALRRGGPHALRIRAGRFQHLDLDRQHGPQHHGDGPGQRTVLQFPGAGGQ